MTPFCSSHLTYLESVLICAKVTWLKVKLKKNHIRFRHEKKFHNSHLHTCKKLQSFLPSDLKGIAYNSEMFFLSFFQKTNLKV
jgi:hypothetical protein